MCLNSHTQAVDTPGKKCVLTKQTEETIYEYIS